MKFYAPFCLPFLVGALVMAAVIAWKYVVWFAELPRADKKRVLFGIPTPRTLGAVGEVIGECLLHRRIFRVNPLLGYMHMSLAPAGRPAGTCRTTCICSSPRRHPRTRRAAPAYAPCGS